MIYSHYVLVLEYTKQEYAINTRNSLKVKILRFIKDFQLRLQDL